MKLEFSFSELSSTLGYINTILSDKTVEESMKNIIFVVNEDERVSVVAYSPLTFSRTKLRDIKIEGVKDSWEFQVKVGDLNKIVSSFSSLSRTKVDKACFEKINDKIRLTILEVPLEGGDETLNQESKFNMNDIAIIKTVKEEIKIDFPTETETFISNDLLLYLDSLFPLMNNDTSNSMVSKLNFAEDYVFVITSYMSSFFMNKLPDAFKGLTLGYSSVNFLNKLCLGVDSIDVYRSDKYLCIHSGDTEAFLKYQSVKIKHQPYVERMSNDDGVVVDRLYLKDVLKRMMISSTDGLVKMTDNGLEVSNENFSQHIPINKCKGDVSDLKFKVSVPVLLKSIIGDDNVLQDDLFIYFVKSGASGYVIYIKDSTGAWFSTTQVRK